MKNYLFILMSSFFLLSCATRPPHPTLKLVPESEYFAEVEKNTKKTQVYDGLYAVVEVQATLLNRLLLRNQVDFLAQQSQWAEDQYKSEVEKFQQNTQKQTEMFLSFYVPERKHDDLAKTKTLWKIFLDCNGQRYEGKASKIVAVFGEVKSVYPHHNRWSTPYKVAFALPTEKAEACNSKLTMTGPIGSVQLEFAQLTP